MTTFLTLHRQLDRIIAKSHSIRLASVQWVEVSGGLPRSVAPRRYAFIAGQMVEPFLDEARDAFELRLAAQAQGGTVVLGGLPALPGSNTLAPERMDEADALDYWGDGPLA